MQKVLNEMIELRYSWMRTPAILSF